MEIDFWGKYKIDYKNIKDKLDIISRNSSTENASFINETFKRIIEYLFSPVSLKASNMTNIVPNISKDDCVIVIDNVNDSSESIEKYKELFSIAKKIIIVGNNENYIIDNKISVLNIKYFKKILSGLKDCKSIFMRYIYLLN